MIRHIEIDPASNGFIVKVGCQVLVYQGIGELASDLMSYLENPDETEKKVLKDKCYNRNHTMGPPEGPRRIMQVEAQRMATYCGSDDTIIPDSQQTTARQSPVLWGQVPHRAPDAG